MSDATSTPVTPAELWARHDELASTNPFVAAHFAVEHRLEHVPRPASVPRPQETPAAEPTPQNTPHWFTPEAFEQARAEFAVDIAKG